MTIKDVEERTGLSRSNIRFYEKEKLIEPSRNESNGYRDYSENDVENIKKIAYLRTLGISIEDIRNIISVKCSQFPSCVDFTGFNCIQNCVYCYYLSFFSKIALKHRPHYFHI